MENKASSMGQNNGDVHASATGPARLGGGADGSKSPSVKTLVKVVRREFVLNRPVRRPPSRKPAKIFDWFPENSIC